MAFAGDELSYKMVDWSFERSAESFEDLAVGTTVSFTKRISDDDIREFAEMSGDTNRLHLDEKFAEQTRFEERIVHGMLLAGLIIAALARLPGLTMYLSQDLEFHNPATIGETYTARS